MLAQFKSSYEGGLAQFRASYAAATSIELIWNIDAGNIDPLVFTVENAETATPTIYLKVRRTPSALGSNWIHWHFGLSGINGKRPIFEIEVTGRRTNSYAAAWRPQHTYDFVTWAQSTEAFTTLTTPDRVRFQYPAAFTANTVYLADHPVFRQQDFADIAADLAADVSGLVSVSASANAAGVIGLSPTETDDLGRAVGGQNIYGFVLGNDGATDDGGAKRWVVVDAGIHSGEVIDGWPLKGLIDFYLNGTGDRADKLRANWKIGLYFCLTPNGRYGGNWRGNFERSEDPNRDWGDAGAFSLAESVIVRDAILADLAGHIPEVGLSLHSDAGSSTTNSIWWSSASTDQSTQTTWLDALNTADSTTWSRSSTNITSSVTGWHAARGTQVCLLSEPGTRGTNTQSRYIQTGQRYLEATAIADAAGVFYSPAVLTLSVPTVTDITATSVRPQVTITNAAAGTLRYAIYPAAAAEPTYDLITGWSGTPIASGSETARETSGTQTWATLATGLDPATDYKIAFVWEDGVDQSAVAWSDLWTTLALVNATGTAALSPVSLTAPTATASGTVVVNATASADLSPVSLAAPTASAAGTVVIAGNAPATLAPVSLTAPTAAATAGTVINATASASIAATTLTAPDATAAGSAVASAALDAVELSAPQATAAGTAVINATASAALSPIAMTAPQASATSEIVINASASAALAAVSLASPTATGVGTANAAAVVPSLNLTAPTASAVGTVQADGAASAALAPITLTAPNASAFEGIRLDPALLRSVYVRLGRDEPTVRMVRDEAFVRIETQSTTTQA